MNEQLQEHIFRVARENPSIEICGVIVIIKGRERLWLCKNLSDGNDHFIMDPEDYAKAEDLGEITAIVHSHPITNANPSPADLRQIEETQLPWIIVNPQTGQITITNPSGYVMPLIGREFVHGIVDCYTLIKDYHEQELNIEIPDFNRTDLWWEQGEDLYIKGFETAGFIKVNELKENTCILMMIQSKVFNHAAVYLGNDKIIHHVQGRLSSRDVWGGYWRKASCGFYVRHRDLC